MDVVTETRWLTAEQQKTWRALLLTMHLLSQELDRQAQRDAGMPHAYYQILATLSEQAGWNMRMSDLATVTDYSQSRLSHAVARLEDAGWVCRKQCPKDRRGTFAVLTDAGFAALNAAAPGYVRCVREMLFDQLTDEQVRQLREICEAALRKLAAGRTCGAMTGEDSNRSTSNPA